MAKKKTSTEEANGIAVATPPVVVPVVTTAIEMKRIRVTLRGKPPGLLMNSKGGMVDGNSKQAKIPTPEQQARNSAYWIEVNGKPQLALPWENLYKSIVAAAKRFKFKGRETMAAIVASTITSEQDMIPLGTDQYRHDRRWGLIPPRTGGTVMLNRAHLPQWEATFVLMVDDEFYPADALLEVLKTAGKVVGVCANRPASQGPHGRFDVTGWQHIE